MRWSRPVLVALGGAVGLAFGVAGSGNFNGFYSNFLIALDYLITPWLAVILLDFYWRHEQHPEVFGSTPGWNHDGITAYLAGLAASVPFMSAGIFSGPLAALFGCTDISYFVGFLVAGVLYLALARPSGRLPGDSRRSQQGSSAGR